MKGLVLGYGGCYGSYCGPTLPWWAAVLTFAAVVALIVLLARRQGRRLRSRAREVELAAASAAEHDPAFAADRVRSEAERLFRDATADRVVKSVRRIAYVGLVQSEGRVVVYIDAWVRARVEGPTRPEGGRLSSKRVFEYWTLSKRDHHWNVEKIESLNDGKYHLDEPIVVTAGERDAYTQIADRIESELRAIGAWEQPAPDGPVADAPNGSFTQWLRYELVPQLHEVAAGRRDPPSNSMVATRAIREFDGYNAADPLISVLLELDRLAESSGQQAT